MTEIKIEKKKPVLAWLIAAILLVAALVYYFGYIDSGDTDAMATAPADTSTTAATPTNGAVADFVEYVDAGRTLGLDHEYTNEALTRLVAAIRSKAEQVGHNVSVDLDKVKEHADHITRDPFETTHANSIRSAADILTNAMRNIQQAKYPNLESQLDEVRDAANKIDPKVLTLDQRDAVKNFFDKSARLLESMS